MPTALPLVSGTLAQNCYPATPQALLDEWASKSSATMPDITGILIQDAAPDPIYRGNKGWIATSGGIPIYPLNTVMVWHPTVGHWVGRHPLAASDPSWRIYVGTAASVDTYDYGEVGVANVASGPFWEIVTAAAGRVPIGVGVIPTSSPAASIANPLDTTDSLGNSGEYKHVLSGAEGAVATHTHPIGVCDPASDDGFFNIETPARPTPNWSGHYITGSGSTPATPETTANLFTLQAADGSGVVSDGHNTMPPWIGVYFIRRTIRQFYRAG